MTTPKSKKKAISKQPALVALTEEDRAAGLAAAAASVREYGMTVAEETAGSLSVALGMDGLVPNDAEGERFVAALSVAGSAKAQVAWRAAVARASVEGVVEELAGGWAEVSSSGSTRYFFSIPAAAYHIVETVWNALPAHKALTSAGKTIAELSDSPAAVAPSLTADGEWTRISGKSGRPTPLTVSELFGLACAVDEAAVVVVSLSPSSYDRRQHSPRTTAARDFFNRSAPESRIYEALKKAGWDLTEVVDEVTGQAGSYYVNPVNGPGRVGVFGGSIAPSSLHVWCGATDSFGNSGYIRRADSGWGEDDFTLEECGGFAPNTLHRAFDVVAILEHGGDVDAAAEALLASQEARIEVRMFAADRIVEVDSSLPTLELVSKIVNAVARSVGQ